MFQSFRIFSGEMEKPVLETDISKDVTVLISRIGEYKQVAKVKWVDFSPAVKQIGEEIRHYQVFNVIYCNSFSVFAALCLLTLTPYFHAAFTTTLVSSEVHVALAICKCI